MSLFTAESTGILKDATWLQPLSDPPNGHPVCREIYLEIMATYLSELFKTGQARNLFVYGKPGTGKTICIRHLLSEVNRHAAETKSPILTAYVNAGKTRTPYYTMSEILKELGVNIPDVGWQMFRLKHAFQQLLTNNSVLIAIDEVDSIIYKEKEPLVYYLNRQPKTTLILISNRIEDSVQLPARALSTLHPKIFKLEPYTSEEARKILRERVEHAFKPGAIINRLLETVAKATSEAGDIRLGLHTLLTAALNAEQAHKQKIDAEDVLAALQVETGLERLKKLDELKGRISKLARQK